jgi:hypothetical protein
MLKFHSNRKSDKARRSWIKSGVNTVVARRSVVGNFSPDALD